MLIPSLVSALVLALLHLFASHLRFLDRVPRSRWLSAAGGVSVAYVFLHLLPELAEGRETLEREMEGVLGVAEHLVYLIAFLGLAAFYGLERAAKTAGGKSSSRDMDPAAQTGVFWVHIGSFSLYNALIGYLLLHRRTSGLSDLVLFAVAMALHFVVTDFGLREHHRHAYVRVGRWVLSAAILVGWAVGAMSELPEAAITALIALLAGGVILNVLKEELPEERESRYTAFLLGGMAYAALLLTL